MQRRVEGNRRGLLRGAVVGVARAWWWGEGAASSGRTGAPFHVAPRWGASGLSLFHSLRGLFPRRQAGGQRGRRGTVDAGRGGAAYDPARRVPRVSSYTLPRTIDNEPWRTAVVYCREFFGWPTESPAPNSFLRAPSLRRGERRSASHSHHRTTIIGLAWKIATNLARQIIRDILESRMNSISIESPLSRSVLYSYELLALERDESVSRVVSVVGRANLFSARRLIPRNRPLVEIYPVSHLCARGASVSEGPGPFHSRDIVAFSTVE